jgi:hypothetical protein
LFIRVDPIRTHPPIDCKITLNYRKIGGEGQRKN